ncbi:MAG TPA: hypothetical protein VGD81_15630, partial [Opitutaceae bacterium]
LKAHPRHAWASAALQRHYRARGDAEKLWSLLSERVRRVPDDLPAVSAWVQLSAVLDRASGAPTASLAAATQRLAASPAPAGAAAAAQAAVLWREKRYEEAFTRLTPASAGGNSRTGREIAFWLAVVSSELGRPVPDRVWRAARALPLLEEESVLLRAAVEKLGRSTASTLSGKTT